MCTRKDYEQAHKAAFRNKESIVKSSEVACYYCLSIMKSQKIKEYTDDQTGICPLCGVDTLIPDVSGLPIQSIDYLRHMHIFGFE